MLTEDKCRALAPTLQALRLFQHGVSSGPLPQLSLLSNLTYLGVYVTASNEDSLLAALSCMPRLKALDMWHMGARMLAEFPSRCPQLEHLSLSVFADGGPVGPECFDRIATHLEQLTSLSVCCCRHIGVWHWFERIAERGRLEFVNLRGREAPGVPVEVVVKALQKCRRLYALGVPTNKYTVDEWQRIVDATEKREESEELPNHSYEEGVDAQRVSF